MPQWAKKPLDKLTEPWGSDLADPAILCTHFLQTRPHPPSPILSAGTQKTAQNLLATQQSDRQVLEQVALRAVLSLLASLPGRTPATHLWDTAFQARGAEPVKSPGPAVSIGMVPHISDPISGRR